jgi:hypothetical protein
MGCLFMALGYHTYITQWDYKYGFPVPKSSGIVVGFMGVFVIIYSLIFKADNRR